MSTLPSMHKEAFNLLCNDRIGGGIARQVWNSLLLPNSVVKVEENGGSFQNVMEWETWKRVKGTPAEKWFAPCEWISPNGSILIMAKTMQPHEYPEQMPIFLCDFKRTNYGVYDGRLVCHDYGLNFSMEYGLFTKRMKKAEWWDAL